jgi:PD-(D/E)XK nuclease superfamily
MIRLSHSALETLLICERKFQLDRLLVGGEKHGDSDHTLFGRAFGAGIATYMLTQDQDKALYEAWKEYPDVLDMESKKKTEWHAYNMLIASFPHLDNLLQDWELAYFNGKPAVELSFRLNIDSKFYFVGYVDIVLKNKWDGRYAIMENKTTGLNLISLDALYQNSGQALGYSIVLDKIVGEEQTDYTVLYFAGQLGSGNGFQPVIHTLPYPKNLNDRLNWFISLGMDVERLHRMLELNVFPLRGKSCLNYMRPCSHLGTCSLHALDQYKVEEEDTIVYDFVYNLDEVIEDHLRRVRA